MLVAGQLAGVTLQIVSVTRVLGHPLHLVAAVGLGRHLGSAGLWSRWFPITGIHLGTGPPKSRRHK